MAALITFLAGQNHSLSNVGSSGSGLGFFGLGGFASSVAVGSYQDTTYITDATGTNAGPQVNNFKYLSPGSGVGPGSTNYALQALPNYMATLNIRFTNDTPVKTQNATVRVFDRSNLDNPAVGVLTKAAIHVHPLDTAGTGSGDIFWQTPGGSGAIMSFSAIPSAVSPGSGGFSPSGSNTVDTQHDWYISLSAMPTSVGSKSQFALAAAMEFL